MSDKQYLIKVFDSVEDLQASLHTWSCVASKVSESSVGGWVIDKLDGVEVVLPNSTIMTLVEVEDEK